MSLIRFNEVSLSFGDKPILDRVSFVLEEKDRLALIGRNGVGKSTFLKLILGEIAPDSGAISSKNMTISTLPQAVPTERSGTVYEYVAAAYSGTEDWEEQYRVDRVISQVNLSPESELTSLSGGQIRRCLLASALVNEPDVLLLDEPTNHLDIPSIVWLEDFLLQAKITLIVITHDRDFMQRVSNSIVEIDRGRLISWRGDYHGFLKHKAQQAAAEQHAQDKFDKLLAQEEIWIRQGVKARRTRNEGRVRALKKMRAEAAVQRKAMGSMQLTQQRQDASGKQVFVVDDMTLRVGDHCIVRDFSTVVQRRDKIGIVGPNGCGKTTLIRGLLGDLPLEKGRVERGTQLDVAYFDQHRSTLDLDQTVMDVVSQGRQSIPVNGKDKHIISYLQDFLFTPEKARGQVRYLSGGECNRLLLAKLFSKPANFLVLDEPTNDLDVESLELLEEYLLQFEGTIMLVTHDRALLNHVVTSTWVFQPDCTVIEYSGGYAEYQQASKSVKKSSRSKKTATGKPQKSSTKLSHGERRELNKLPDQIAVLEQKLTDLQTKMSAPGFYAGSQEDVAQATQALEALESQLEVAYQRWEQLAEREGS